MESVLGWCDYMLMIFDEEKNTTRWGGDDGVYSIMIHEFIKVLAIMSFLRWEKSRRARMKTFIALNIKSIVEKIACSTIITTLKLKLGKETIYVIQYKFQLRFSWNKSIRYCRELKPRGGLKKASRGFESNPISRRTQYTTHRIVIFKGSFLSPRDFDIS